MSKYEQFSVDYEPSSACEVNNDFYHLDGSIRYDTFYESNQNGEVTILYGKKPVVKISDISPVDGDCPVEEDYGGFASLLEKNMADDFKDIVSEIEFVLEDPVKSKRSSTMFDTMKESTSWTDLFKTIIEDKHGWYDLSKYDCYIKQIDEKNLPNWQEIQKLLEV